jgi:hypothetical protein
MSRLPPQWIQASVYSAAYDRQLLSALFPGPAVSGGMVVAGGGTMNVTVQLGHAAVPTANNSGTVVCTWDADEVVPIPTPVPAAGNARIDSVVVHPRATDVDGGPDNDFILEVISGQETLSPIPPNVPAGRLRLADVHVAGGVNAINPADVTDKRPLQQLWVPQAQRPAPVTAGALQSYTDPDGEVWIAKPGVYGGQWRKARDYLRCLVVRNGAWITYTTWSRVIWDAVDHDPYGMHVGNGFVRSLIPGVYRYTTIAGANVGGVNNRYYIMQNSMGPYRIFYQEWLKPGWNFPACSVVKRANANMDFSTNTLCSVAVWSYAGGDLTSAALEFVSPLP